MTPPESEPVITVNGNFLTEGQAMSVRVILELFLLKGSAVHRAELGQVGLNYAERAREVRRLMVQP